MSSSEAAAWSGAIATLLAVLMALFKEDITSWWRRPKLEVLVRLAPPDCHKTELNIVNQATRQLLGSWPCYYLRIWVENRGIRRADQVQVFVSQLLRRRADGTFAPDDQFLPMNLKWAHSQQRPEGPEIFAEGISRDMGKHCDLGHIPHPNMRKRTGEVLAGVPDDQVIVRLDLEVEPNTKSHLLPPGVYRLVLKVAAANDRPVTKILELSIAGKWFDDERKMFTEGVGLRDVS
ncbi:MAG: hypothetical protein MUF27_17790 [Acidobacteria bacterium]|nr:hypothetical protein [Acidobacteriota bacterium]